MLRLTRWLAPVLLLTVVTDISAQSELQQARQMLMDLARQVRESAEIAHKEDRKPKFSWEDYNRRLLQVQGLINQGIVSALNRQPRPSEGELQNELREVVGLGVNAQNMASAFSFQTAAGKLYVVAYGLGVLVTNSRSWIGVLGSPAEGKPCVVLASVENSLPNKTIAVRPLSQPGESPLTFLAYGINWGDAHNRLTVIAYSLTGEKLRAIWSRADLPEGQVRVADGKIRLTYLSALAGPADKSVRSIAQTYRLTPAGIKLVSR